MKNSITVSVFYEHPFFASTNKCIFAVNLEDRICWSFPWMLLPNSFNLETEISFNWKPIHTRRKRERKQKWSKNHRKKDQSVSDKLLLMLAWKFRQWLLKLYKNPCAVITVNVHSHCDGYDMIFCVGTADAAEWVTSWHMWGGVGGGNWGVHTVTAKANELTWLNMPQLLQCERAIIFWDCEETYPCSPPRSQILLWTRKHKCPP